MSDRRFIAVRGWMDCRFAERDDKPLVEFSWQGKDEMDDASGRGWGVIEDDGTLAPTATGAAAQVQAPKAVRPAAAQTSSQTSS